MATIPTTPPAQPGLAAPALPSKKKAQVPAGPRQPQPRSPWGGFVQPGMARRMSAPGVPGEARPQTSVPGRTLMDIALPNGDLTLGKVGAAPGGMLDLTSLPQLGEARRSLMAIFGRAGRGSL